MKKTNDINDAHSDTASDAIRRFQRVANKYTQVQEKPIRIDDEHTISMRDVHIIEQVGKRTLINVTDIAQHFSVTKSAASQTVSKLEKQGYLLKLPSATSNKALQLSLTPLGWQAYEAHEKYHGDGREKLISSLQAYPLPQILSFSMMLELFSEVLDERLMDE